MIIFTILISDIELARKTLGSIFSLRLVNWRLVYRVDNARIANDFMELLNTEEKRIIAESGFDEWDGNIVLPLVQGDRILPAIDYLDNERIPQGYRWAYADTLLDGEHASHHWAKPDFSPELQLATNFIQRPIFLSSAISEKFFGSEGEIYQAFQGLLESLGPIFHIQKALLSVSSLFTDKGDELRIHTDAANRFAKYLGYRNFKIHVKREFSQHLDRDFHALDLVFPDSGPGVSIIIPTKDHADLLRTCVTSILKKTRYRNYRIIVIDNNSTEPETHEYFEEISRHKNIEVLRVENKIGYGFNYSYINNVAARASKEELLCFLNNDTEVISESWLSQLVGVAKNPQVGSAGALLMYPNSWVQHSGINFGMMYNKLPVPAFKGLEQRDAAYFGSLFTMQNYMAVSAACMMVSHDDFINLGGFDEDQFGVAYNDCDFGIRLYQQGKRNVFCPRAVVTHFEGYTRGTGVGNDNPAEEAAFLQKHGSLVDVYYNRYLTVDSQNCTKGRIARYPINEKRNLREIVAYTHNLNFEGAPLVLFELMQALSEKTDSDLTVISPMNGLLADRYREIGIQVIIDSSIGIGGKHDEASLAELLKRCQSYLGNASAVIANTVLGFQFVLAAEQLSIPGIWVVHESEPPFVHLSEHGGVAQYFAKMTANIATQVVFVAETTRDYYKHVLGLTDNTAVIYNALDTDRLLKERAKYTKYQARKLIDIDHDRIVALCVGSVCARKRQQDIIEIMAQVKEETAECLEIIIVGDRAGEYSDELRRKLKTLGKRATRIRIVDETPDPFLYFIAADFFLFCSGLESYPRVLQEALYFDLPAVTTPVFGNREIVSGGKNGLFFEVGDTQTAAQHVDRICATPELLRNLKKNCRPGVKRFSDMEKFSDSYLDLIYSATEQ